MGKRAFHPTRENRDEAVALLGKQLIADAYEDRWHFIQRTQDNFYRQTLTTESGNILRVAQVAFDVALFAVEARWRGSPEKDELLRRAFALFYWYAEVIRQVRRAKQLGDDASEVFFVEELHQLGIAAACGHTKFVDWIAPYLHRLLVGGGGLTLAFLIDVPAQLFTKHLLAAISERRWRGNIDGGALKNYAPLLTTAGDAAAFRAALIDYCDYRIAQCFGYDGMDAIKRRRPSVTGSVLDADSWGREFPVELFTLKYAYECSTGGTLSLDADHPLLKTPLMQAPFPQLEPLYEDDFIRQVQRLGFVWFGKWPLMQY